jgi:hypothetical protein
MISVERIASRIYLIRSQKVMLDADLAALYGVETTTSTRLGTSINRSRRW